LKQESARVIQGIVQDGLGQGNSFTQLDWVRQQFRDKIGFDPCPGTLNLRVQDRDGLAGLRAERGIRIEPGAPGFCAAKCFRVKVGDQITAAWIIPEVPGYPDDLVELMAPVRLRDALGLKIGDVVVVRLEK
jgi:riboflavin kinase